MPIVEMKKVLLLAHREEQGQILGLLQKLGSVELANVQSSPDWEELKSLMEPDQPTEQVSPLETRLGEVRYCLDFLQRHFPVKKNFVQQFTGSKLSITRQEYINHVGRCQEVADACAACREADERLVQIRNEEVRCTNFIDELHPWSSLDLPLEEIRSTGWTRTMLAVVPAEGLGGLQEALSEKAEDSFFKLVSQNKDQVLFLLIYPREDEPVIEEICQSAAVSEASFPGISGTVGEAIAATRQRLQALQEEKAALKARVEELLVNRRLFMVYYDYLQNELNKREAAENLARTEAAFYLEGWVPAPALADLTATLEEGADTAVLLVQDPGPGEEFPILLQNQGPTDAFEVVTRLYGSPSTRDLDPTPLMAPFFFVSFGICLSDVCYGALLSTMAFLMSRKMKLAGMGRQLVNLLFWGGLSAILFGVLMGGWFGDLIPIGPLWFNPLDDPMRMLIVSFVVGIIQVYFGMGIQAFRNIKAGRPWDAFFDQGGWYLFLTGLILLILPGGGAIGKWAAIAGALVLILTQGRSQENPVRKLLSGILSLYDVTGFLSDVLSYSRLLALCLATGVIASAVNTMGGMLAGSIVGAVLMVILLAGGHIFNLVISTLSSYVHTSRLQYIEFFNKFFEGGGKAFQPFQIKTKFVDVEEKEAC
ncbi:MAG: V-type ATP synthase subunit I [Firmicutes bacterium]|nr:V-type ATP synthase subunit I [Bacillota bacterium]